MGFRKDRTLQQGTHWLEPVEPSRRTISVIDQPAPEVCLLHLATQGKALVRSEFVLKV